MLEYAFTVIFAGIAVAAMKKLKPELWRLYTIYVLAVLILLAMAFSFTDAW